MFTRAIVVTAEVIEPVFRSMIISLLANCVTGWFLLQRFASSNYRDNF